MRAFIALIKTLGVLISVTSCIVIVGIGMDYPLIRHIAGLSIFAMIVIALIGALFMSFYENETNINDSGRG